MPKTTAQLKVLTDRLGPAGKLAIIEMSVEDLIASPATASEAVQRVVRETESHLQAGQDTLVMTSRKLVTGTDELSSLKIGSAVAEALVSVLQHVEVRPRYIIAKVSKWTGFLDCVGTYACSLSSQGRHYLLRCCN